MPSGTKIVQIFPRGSAETARPAARIQLRGSACARNGRVLEGGFCLAASLDELSAATGLNRPSLYGAFGDKRALYIQAYQSYRELVRDAFAPMFADARPLAVKVLRLFDEALKLYVTGDEAIR